MKLWSALFFALLPFSLLAQRAGYWQQAVEYTIEAKLDTESHQYTGTQTIKYTNNSPDTLHQAYFHLYNNAFQPGSDMAVRSAWLPDPDDRLAGRFADLAPSEQGYLHVANLTMDGKEAEAHEQGTILEVTLPEPLLPGAECTFAMTFEGQVPIQIRRNGRDNAEGIAYSMAQWYPKLSEYDHMGWHPNPYIAREFHGVWGDFDVKLTLPAEFTVAASGVLQNPADVGHGYLIDDMTPAKTPRRAKELTWHFVAEKVHDFAWAADPDYTHKVVRITNGPELHFFYDVQADSLVEAWEALPDYAVKGFQKMTELVGKYPYPVYNIVQGGDGGMEYAMLTLITGHRKLGSLVGVTYHEMVHSWFQMVLATNESLYPWMDEGFTSYYDVQLEEAFLRDGIADLEERAGFYDQSHFYVALLTRRNMLEASSTHADHYSTNTAYGIGTYTKGALFLHHLRYTIGEEAFDRTMKRYWAEWQFKHPTDQDFLRVAEKESGMVLDWLLEYLIYTTKAIDYTAKVNKGGGITVARNGLVPMPVELEVEYTDGSKELFYIPLDLMRGAKEAYLTDRWKWTQLADWPWVQTEYAVPTERDVKAVTVDPLGWTTNLPRYPDPAKR